MPYVVTDNCIRCKYMDCVEACPVSCFYEGENMLVICPDECIDCGLCEPECSAHAIVPDSDPASKTWVAINETYANLWPNISIKKRPPCDAAEFDGVADKIRKYFSVAPGAGD